MVIKGLNSILHYSSVNLLEVAENRTVLPLFYNAGLDLFF